MNPYSFEDLVNQLDFFNTIKEDYLYNFSLTLNKPLIGPHMLQLILTTKCNLKCTMCGVWNTNEEELDTFYVKKLIDDTYKMGNLQEVYFTGGEVLFRPDIFALIKYVEDYYPHIKTSLNTNGVVLNKMNINKLIDVKLKNLSISMDSPDPRIHNALRGEGVLGKIVEALTYINAEKKRRNARYPDLHICSILMDQTIDTMHDMLDFCMKHNVISFHVQPYVCNSDLRGKREDSFWIKKERLPALQAMLEKIEKKKENSPLTIIMPKEKIYKYFSEPFYIDKCYSGFTRAIVVGKKICFVCNGPNNEEHQHFGNAEKDSINAAWFSEMANHFRDTIKSCKRNCAQFCSIRSSSDSIPGIHQRLISHDDIFLVFRELSFLKEHIAKYPSLEIRELIEADLQYVFKNSRGFLETIKNIQLAQYDNEINQYLLSDLKLFHDYMHTEKSGLNPENKDTGSLSILDAIEIYKKELERCLLLKEGSRQVSGQVENESVKQSNIAQKEIHLRGLFKKWINQRK